jgi:threonine synthase
MTTVRTSPRYTSTRDKGRVLVSFEEALLSGLAPDGGLYIPEFIPRPDPKVWRASSSLAGLGAEVLGCWLKDEVGEEALAPLLADALDFPVPIVALADGLYVLELFHGPTLSFKDVAARTMARLTNYFLRERRERVIILVATSGDTGSAVADGFAGQDNLEVVLLYPKGKVSAVQERQLIIARPGVRAFAVEGSFDDCQRLVKAAFADGALAHLPLSSANSINIGRLLPQSLYYLWAALQSGLERLNFCVPSGNLGSVTGGILAAQGGLKVNKFIVAHNANDFFPRYLQGLREGFKPSVATVSNAMDVGAPSNFERITALLDAKTIAAKLWGVSISDEATRSRMKRSYKDTAYLADPHTAVGIEAVARYREETGDATPTVVLATAHPAKFPRTVSEVLAIPAPKVAKLEALWRQPVAVTNLAPTPEALREALLSLSR